MKSRQNYYTIGEMADLCDINPKTLRYYDDIELVKPSYKSEDTGYRYYSKEQAFTIYTIKKLQKLEFSLKEIRALIQSDDLEMYEREIGNKINYLDQKIESLNKIRNEGKMLLNKVSNDRNFYGIHHAPQEKLEQSLQESQNVTIEEIPRQYIFYTSKEMDNYNNFEISIERWFDIYKRVEEKGLLVNGHIILRYLTDSIMDQFYKSQIKLEVCLPVDISAFGSEDELPEDLCIKEFGGFKTAVYYHFGKYENIYQSHLNVLRWIDSNGYEINGYLSEEYLISPFELKANENYLTKIIYPVRRK